jgi:C-terminal processing protease CtpA/Prc
MDEHVERKKPEAYRIKSKKIAYIDLGDISAEDLEKTMKNKADFKGLILDLRKYPEGGYTKDLLEKNLYPKPTEYM